MAYRNFKTLQDSVEAFALNVGSRSLFTALAKPVPEILRHTLEQGQALAFPAGSEKARSEFVIAPILLAVRQMLGGKITIHSGERFDVDSTIGLVGECDFIISRSAIAVPTFVQSPILSVVEAKKQDLELGLGQCVAQMVAAQKFNLKRGHETDIYGCVTTGEIWFFMQLEQQALSLDTDRYYLNQLEQILGVLYSIVQS